MTVSYFVQWKMQFLYVQIHNFLLLGREFSLLTIEEAFQLFLENVFIQVLMFVL